MKKIILSFVIAICLAGCAAEKQEYCNRLLDDALTMFMKEYPKNDVYNLLFYNTEDRQFFQITEGRRIYERDLMDGCFMKDSKLVYYGALNRSGIDSMLNISEIKQCYDSLSNYYDSKESLVSYELPPHTVIYRILSKDSIRRATDDELAYHTIAKDTNVVRNKQLNILLNSYINDNKYSITYINYKNINGIQYFCIGSDFSYDNDAVGMFYRDGRIVVVYTDGNGDEKYIDKSKLRSVDNISDYRLIHRNFPFRGQDMYRVQDNGKFVIVGSRDSVFPELWYR